MPYIIEKTFNSEIFTKVGNPTITADGIASGFSKNNYLTKTFAQVENNEVVFKIGFNLNNTTTGGTENHTLLELFDTTTSQNTSIFAIRMNKADKISLSQPPRFGIQWFKDIQPTNYSANALIELKLNRTTQTLSYKYYENDVLHTQGSTASTADWGVASLAQIGYRINPFLGSIDLKQFKVTVDGKVVLNGTTSKEVYVLPSIQEIKDYYSNTLIIQYNGKPKAKATIEMLVDLIYDDVILNQIQEAFDWKTAVGKQLDIIGQWVGVSRVYQQSSISGKTYLSYPGWDDETDTLQHGYSDYTTFNSNTGNDLTYKELETLEANLNDDDYRTVIGLKIIKNNINHTAKNIDDAIWEYFNGKVYTTWSDYKITYHYPAKLTTIIEVCNAKNVLLAPIGVNINLLQTE